MKYVFFLLIAVATSVTVIAQDCSGYYFMQNGKTVEMTIYNKKDKITGVQTYKVSDVSKTGGTTLATINGEMTNEKGKSLSKSVVKVSCAGNVLNMDMSMYIPSAQQQQFKNTDATANAVYLQYPAAMKAGDALPDGNFSMDMKTDGLNMSVTVQISNRTVEAKEAVTTPAGTWDCFKINSSQKIQTKMSGIGMPAMNMEVTEWFAPGFGVVKTDTKYGKTEITAIK
ncbi:MAG: hypothetical protein SFU21_10915 [Flavihumibacter sp.]|nr:hypothetical protein [Flavihumibacter sp.]